VSEGSDPASDEPPASYDFTDDDQGPVTPASIEVRRLELDHERGLARDALDHERRLEREQTRRLIIKFVLVAIALQFPAAGIAVWAGASWDNATNALVYALTPFVALAVLIGHDYFHKE
jgi:hypothetical protein